jgi:hypothetical protein
MQAAPMARLQQKKQAAVTTGTPNIPAFPAQGKIKSPVKFYGPLWTPQAIDHARNIPITCHTPS